MTTTACPRLMTIESEGFSSFTTLRRCRDCESPENFILLNQQTENKERRLDLLKHSLIIDS